jgi:serine/threonine-protein kinase RsbW
MDWLLDTRRTDATRAAVAAVEDHLLRHTTDEALVGAAVESARTALDQIPLPDDSALWLHLDWTRIHPTLTLRPVAHGTADLADGLLRLAPDERPAGTTGQDSHLDLAVPREVPASFDPEVGAMVDLDPMTEGPACLPVAMAAAAELHPVASPEQVAGAAGALIADASLGSTEIGSLEQAVDHFLALHAALGGSARPLEVRGGQAELLIERGVFGSAPRQVPSLARLTEALAGRIAARATGGVTVVVDEDVAHGDPASRLLLLPIEDEEVVGGEYRWPPAGIVERVDPSPRLEMSVSLPRQSHSVPVIRRLAAQILRAFGADSDSIHDVELAISEACANVIQHAGDSSEGYEVSFELASDRCAITVLDRGEGFDASGITDQDDHDAESGRGLTLMRALVDNLNFVSEPKVGAVVHMVKSLDYDRNHPFHRSRTA